MTRKLALLTLLALLPLLPAIAGDGSCRTAQVSIEQAIGIARGAGIAHIDEVECDRGRWEVEGWTADGRKMEVKISAQDGRVLDTAYD